MQESDDGQWIEYRRLILNELRQLNETSSKHAAILIDIDKTLIKHDENLEKHMSRSESAEEELKILKTQIAPLIKVSWLSSFFLKVSSGLAFVVGLVLGILEIVKHIGPGR